MQTISISGPGDRRGLEHGRVLREPIRETIAALKSHLSTRGHDVETLGLLLVSSTLCDAAATLTPDLWDEVAATAQGADVPLQDILLLTFLDEVWGLTRRSGCSVVARRRALGVEVGQTMDLPAWTSGRVTVLRASSQASPTALVMAYPGMLGLSGANDAGLAVAVNALEQLGFSEHGLGVAFVVRHLLSMTSIDAAVSFVESVPHAAGQAYTIGSRDRIVTIEAGPGHVEQVSPAGASACLHTNHLLADAARARESSITRLRVLEESAANDIELSEMLSGAVVLDGVRYDDPNSTFAAFMSVTGGRGVRFIDGDDLRAGRREWTPVPFRQ